MRNDFILWQKKNKKKFPLIKKYCFVYGNYIYTKKKKTKQNGYWMEHVRAVRSEKTQVCEEAKSWKRFQERQRDKFVFFVDAEKTPRQCSRDRHVCHCTFIGSVSEESSPCSDASSVSDWNLVPTPEEGPVDIDIAF